MNLNDFSNGFDTLLSSYADKAMVGDNASRATLHLDEWEKSLFLTEYQEEFVLSLYSGRNSSGRSFEETEELRRYLSPLVDEATLEPKDDTGLTGMDADSKFFQLPEGLWFITYESVLINNGRCKNSTTLEVVPATQDEYNRLRKNPFRGANDRRALRLDIKGDIVEIVSKYTVSEYYLRYLKRPSPIILVDLPDGLTVNGEDEATECQLPEALHQRILEGAVDKALRSRGIYNTEKRG